MELQLSDSVLICDIEKLYEFEMIRTQMECDEETKTIYLSMISKKNLQNCLEFSELYKKNSGFGINSPPHFPQWCIDFIKNLLSASLLEKSIIRKTSCPHTSTYIEEAHILKLLWNTSSYLLYQPLCDAITTFIILRIRELIRDGAQSKKIVEYTLLFQ